MIAITDVALLRCDDSLKLEKAEGLVKRADIIRIFRKVHSTEHEGADFDVCKLDPCCTIDPKRRRSIQVGLEQINKILPTRGLPRGGLRGRFDRICEEGSDPFVLAASLELAAYSCVLGPKGPEAAPGFGNRTVWDVLSASSPLWRTQFRDLPRKLDRLADEIECVTKKESFEKVLSFYWMSSALSMELWLRALPLSPKSKTHVRSLLHGLVEYAMFAGILEVGRNPISLVQNKGAGKRIRVARSLTVEQFQALLSQLHEPFGTMALLCVCLGLRISEALGLRWSDVDWLGAKVSVRRGIVMQRIGDCKTEASAKTFLIAPRLLDRLKTWKQMSQFSEPDAWIFASPANIGRLPYSYTGVRQELSRAATAAGIGHVSTHAFRHTYRSWLDQVGTQIAVQQKAMRHTDLRMTLHYGDVMDDRIDKALEKVADLAFEPNGTQTARESS